jgi:hypothetical protein
VIISTAIIAEAQAMLILPHTYYYVKKKTWLFRVKYSKYLDKINLIFCAASELLAIFTSALHSLDG